jgi:RNA polymerase sigma-70 factor (ECF subfamily)
VSQQGGRVGKSTGYLRDVSRRGSTIRAVVKYPKKTLPLSFFGSTSYHESTPLASSLSDEQLMIRYQDSDEAAFEEIYARYGKKIYGFLMRRLGQPDDCAELFQETFLRLHRGRSSYNPEMPFKTWLYTIANNLVRDTLRIKMRSKSVRATEAIENRIERAIPDGNYKLQSFKEAFASLTDDQREAIVLSRFEGLKYEEISRVTGRSTEAVNQLIQRALRHVRECADDS